MAAARTNSGTSAMNCFSKKLLMIFYQNQEYYDLHRRVLAFDGAPSFIKKTLCVFPQQKW